MAKGNPNIKKEGVKFSKENQPSSKAKSEGKKRIKSIKEAVEFFGSQLKSEVELNGENLELTFESNIAYQLYKKANEGDLKAIELIARVIPGFLAPTKTALTNSEGEDVSPNFIIQSVQSDIPIDESE